MTFRDQVLTTVRGGACDRVPFTCYKGLLPEGGDQIEGIAHITSAPIFKAEAEGVTHSSRELAPGVRQTRMDTPWGPLTQVSHTETGYGSSWVREHWIKRPEDYCIVEQVLRHTRIAADPAPLAAARKQIGDRGAILAWMNRTPFQRLWIEYTGMERLAFDLMDCPQAVEGVLDAMLQQARQLMHITAQSEAELVWVPDNITGEITGPPMFERYLTPYYREVCDILVPAGKTPCCHMDGILGPIADAVAQTPLPVIEAFTPPPDGNLSVREARECWPDKTLWLNFPSSVHLAPTEEIKRVTEDLVVQAGRQEGFLIGVTENIPASVGTRSLQAIAEALA